MSKIYDIFVMDCDGESMDVRAIAHWIEDGFLYIREADRRIPEEVFYVTMHKISRINYIRFPVWVKGGVENGNTDGERIDTLIKRIDTLITKIENTPPYNPPTPPLTAPLWSPPYYDSSPIRYRGTGTDGDTINGIVKGE